MTRFHPSLVGDAVIGRCERGELADVGAGDEGVAGAAEHEHADAFVGVDPVAGVGERVVHRPGHRVAGLRAIERQERDGAVRCERTSGIDTQDLTGREQ